MFCEQCGKEIKDTAKVCGYCGSRQQPLTAEANPPEAESGPDSVPAAAQTSTESATPVEAASRDSESSAVHPEPASPPPEEISPAQASMVSEPPGSGTDGKPAGNPQTTGSAEAPRVEEVSEPPKAEPTTSQASAAAETAGKAAGRRKWLWGLAGVLVLALALAGYQLLAGGGSSTDEAQYISLSRSCDDNVVAKANRPIVLQYGYWGTANQTYSKANDEVLTIRLRMNNQTYLGERAQPVGWEDVPCLDPTDMGAAQTPEARVLYDELLLDGLAPGVYPITITMSLDQAVSDGFDLDEDGALDMYGPGEILTTHKTLVISD